MNRVLLLIILILYEGKEKRKGELLKRSRLKKKKLLEAGSRTKTARKDFFTGTVQYVCRNLQSSITNRRQSAVFVHS